MFAHFFKTGCQALNELLFYAKRDGQIRVLVGWVDGKPHKKVDIGCVFKQLLGNEACTITTDRSIRRELGAFQKILCVQEHLGKGNHAFGDQFDPFDGAGGGHIRVGIGKRRDDGLF